VWLVLYELVIQKQSSRDEKIYGFYRYSPHTSRYVLVRVWPSSGRNNTASSHRNIFLGAEKKSRWESRIRQRNWQQGWDHAQWLASYLCCSPNIISVRFQVVTAANMKMAVSWNIALCSLVEVHRRFSSTYWLHHQGDKDVGSEHLWNVGKLLPDYTAQYSRKQPSSSYECLN
jgi:hypothetical protein